MRPLRVLVVGAGKLGRQSARKLVAAGHQPTLVEKDFRIAQEAQHTLGEQVLHGDGCDPKVLEQAGVARADVVLALTGDDEDNLVVAELAHRFFGVKCVLARVNDPDNEWLFRPERGVHGAISPASIVADLVEQAVDRQAGGP